MGARRDEENPEQKKDFFPIVILWTMGSKRNPRPEFNLFNPKTYREQKYSHFELDRNGCMAIY